MVNTCCCVPGCSNRGGHAFPSDRDKCKVWVVAIKRIVDQKGKLWWPGDHSTICRSHFVDSDYEDKNKAGTLACMGSNIVLTVPF